MENQTEKKLIKLDLGCGPNKKGADWVGVDQYNMPGVDVVFDIADKTKKWPFEDNSVIEAHASHFLEHLTNLNDKWERTHFFNELYRVLVKGRYENGKVVEGFATLIFPHWASNRYYGDPTHKEPFSEMGFYYLSTDWRSTQAPHSDIKWNKDGYDCNFEATWGYSMRQDLLARNQEFQAYALANFKEAAQDIIATLVKK